MTQYKLTKKDAAEILHNLLTSVFSDVDIDFQIGNNEEDKLGLVLFVPGFEVGEDLKIAVRDE